MNELDILEIYLKNQKSEYQRIDEHRVIDARGCVVQMGQHQIIVYRDGERQWDAVCHYGSYGYEHGLLEIYGNISGGDVIGWLTADDVISRIEMFKQQHES